MLRDDASSVLDRAPISFGAARGFASIGQKTIAIRAIGAVNLFKQVQIGKMISVENQIVAALDLFNSIDRKANSLIDADEISRSTKGTIRE